MICGSEYEIISKEREVTASKHFNRPPAVVLYRFLFLTTECKWTHGRRLSRDVQYSELVLPVCLPDQADPDESNFYEGVKGLVVGWGWVKNRMGMNGVTVESGP